MKIIRNSYLKLFLLFFLLFQLLGTPSLINASLENQDCQKVLVVNSYHPGYTWSDDIMLGIQGKLRAQRGIELIIEHLDTKRHFEKSYFRQLKELYRQKYRSTGIDIIITSDDNALDFILSIRKELFPDIPLIFCGIDHIKPERIAGHEPLYGIEEADSTASTIDLILSIHPDIEFITFIADETSTGKLMIDRTRKLERTFQKNVHFNYIIGVSVEELQLTIKDIPENTVIFYLSFIRDKNGKVFSIEDSMKLIAENANAPVYCSWGFQPVTGVLGGNILSGYKQGEISAEVVRKLLANDSVESIPAIQQAPLVYMFDYKAMARFNIDETRIPQDSIVHNKPVSFYKDHKRIILSILLSGFCLLLFIMLLFLNIQRRKKAETELQLAHDNLEQKIKKRTGELTKSNELLKEEIYDRKRVEREALILRTAVDQVPVGIALADENLNIYFCNPEGLGLRGGDTENLVEISKDAFDNWQVFMSNGEPYEIDNLPLVRAVNKGLTIREEFIVRHQDGSDHICDAVASPIHEDKKIIGGMIVFPDITERKQSENALRESEEKYRSMMEAMVDATYICSSDFRIEYMNPAMITRIGRDATGESCYKVLHGLNEKCSWCIHEKIMGGEDIQYEKVSPKDDKTYCISSSPIFHTDGSVSKLTIYRDVTEIQNMEAQLKKVQRMEAIGTLAGGIAHDFNNILFPVIGYTEMMLDNASEGSDLQHHLNEVLTGSMRARDLVQQILAFSQQAEKELKPIKTQIIIREVLKLMKASFPSTIIIDQCIDKNCGMVLADPTSFHQIAMNLVTNAFHAMEEDGGTLTIGLSEINITAEDLKDFDLRPGRFVRFSVSDTGHGIENDILDRIFEPYFTTKNEGKGTGLGLSVVHGIVKSYKGDISVHSEPDKGTIFNIYLPLFDSIRENAKPIMSPLPVQGGDEHILLVDDEEPILKMEKQMLEHLGYQVTARTSSVEALEAFRSSSDRYDLVITDMTMPNITGEKLAFELKNIRKEIPVILCTGFSEKISKENADALGIDGFLMKPTIKSVLAKTIRNILDTKSLERTKHKRFKVKKDPVVKLKSNPSPQGQIIDISEG